MKIGWQIKALGEACQIKPPKSEARDRLSDNELVSFLPMEDMGIGEKFIRANQAKPLSAVQGSYTYFAEGDVLLAKITPCFENGKLGIAEGLTNGIGFGSSEYIVFRPDKSLSKEWLYYYLSRETFRVEGAARMSGAVGHKRVSKEFIESYPIPVPHLSEQQQIVGILDEAFEGIATAKANAEKNLQNARALFDSYLQSIFTDRGKGWVEKHLKEVCEKITDGTHQTPKYFDEGIVFLSSRNVTSGKIDWNRIKYIDKKQHLEMHKRVAPRLNDILLAKNGTTGVAAIVDRDTTFDIYVSLALLRALPTIRPRFLLYFINSPVAKSQFNKRLKGSGVPNLHLEEIREVRVSFPSNLMEQDHVIADLDSLAAETQRLESIYQQKLAALEELKKSLLHQAFTGQLIKEARSSLVVPFPVKVPDISTTDLEAGILAMGYDLHEKSNRLQFYGHVKAEKTVHMVESYLGIDLERNPFKEAAGPNDYPRLKMVESRAKKAGYFHFRQNGTRYQFTKYRRFDDLVQQTREKLGDRVKSVDELLKLMLPMDTQQAEIFCTVYAAWNNLLLDGQQPTDEEIVFEARENWHPDKLLIPRERFFGAIEFLKEKNIVPFGKGKKVMAKAKKK